MIKTLADLKRLPLGTELILINSLIGPCHKKRKLEKIQSNTLLFSGEGLKGLSRLDFPSCKEFFITEKGFKFIENGELTAEYIFI